jgi:hypothetical protein
MKRRAFIATLASLTVAGCTGTDGTPETVTDTTRETTRRTTRQTTTQRTSATSSATPPEIRDLGVPVGDAACPFDPDTVERVVCHPEQTGEPLQLTPSTDVLALPRDSGTFTLANDTDYDFFANFYNWGLHKRVDGDWYYIVPLEWPEPLHTLPAGTSHEWTLEVDNTQDPSNGVSGETGATVAQLGGGEYAFEVSGWFESGDHEHRVGLGVRFDIDGDPIELSASDGLSGTREGDTVVVTRDDEDETPTDAFVLERVGEGGVPTSKPIQDRIAEQLVRPAPWSERALFRDALAFFADDVSTVRIEQAAEFDPPFDRDERYYLRYRGDIYEADVVSLD